MPSGATGRALGSIISKFKLFKNVGFESFSKLYHSRVVLVMDYCSGIWGYKNLEMCQKIQQRALRFYFGSPSKDFTTDTRWRTMFEYDYKR